MVGGPTRRRAGHQRVGHRRVFGRAVAQSARWAVGAGASCRRLGRILTELVEESFSVLPVSRLDFRTAARFADQHLTGLRSGGALHLAVAANHGAKVHALDRALVQAARALGVGAVLL